MKLIPKQASISGLIFLSNIITYWRICADPLLHYSFPTQQAGHWLTSVVCFPTAVQCLIPLKASLFRKVTDVNSLEFNVTFNRCGVYSPPTHCVLVCLLWHGRTVMLHSLSDTLFTWIQETVYSFKMHNWCKCSTHFLYSWLHLLHKKSFNVP